MKYFIGLVSLLLLISCEVNKVNNLKKLPIVYSPEYNIGFYGIQYLHPFDTGKYGKIVKHLNKTLGVKQQQFHRPYLISDNELLKVHTKSYLNSLQGSETVAKVAEMGILSKLPIGVINNKLLKPIKLATAGTLIAGNLALENGWAINLSGGYHHAKANKGEGFCFFADINLLIETLREESKIKKALIVDLDAHQGNGHESIHGKDKDIAIFDMYNYQIYPGERHLIPDIDYNIELKAHTKDKEYLQLLKENLPKAIAEQQPDIIIYVAGTDIYEKDPLGALSITKKGIIERDAFVFEQALNNKIPIVMTLSGGYHKDSGSIIGESIENLLKNVIELKID